MLELPVDTGHGAAGGGSVLGASTDGAGNKGRHTAESVSSRRVSTQSCDGIYNVLRFKQTRSKCDSTQVYVKNGHTHCIDHCKATTMCGEVQVPNEHLDVSRN